MTSWSIFTHGDLPSARGRVASVPLARRLTNGLVPSAPLVSPREAERIARQRSIAAAVREVAEQVDGSHRRLIRDRAFLIEVANAADQVLELLAELAALGLHVDREEARV